MIYDENGNEINRKFSTKDTTNQPDELNFYLNKDDQRKDSLMNLNGNLFYSISKN